MELVGAPAELQELSPRLIPASRLLEKLAADGQNLVCADDNSARLRFQHLVRLQSSQPHGDLDGRYVAGKCLCSSASSTIGGTLMKAQACVRQYGAARRNSRTQV